MAHDSKARIGVDIGGTFTDVVLDGAGGPVSAKVLTTHDAPERAVMDGIGQVLAAAGVAAGDVGQLIHGTTLATNALIERKGAHTAFLTTEGFRDVIEMRTESRFDQYDLNIVLPEALIPRKHRFVAGGRLAADGRELLPLDEAAIEEFCGRVQDGGFEAVAIGFMHSYVNQAHELRAEEMIAARLPDVSISLSSDVSPQMREYERFNTVCANAYVRPMMASYLERLAGDVKALGVTCPVHMIHSGGGLISLETAMRYPVRLVESGPAGGAIFSADLSRRLGMAKVLSFDMGGTTAKICLIDDHAPKTARTFEVARTTRFAKGSGMPISIPVIEMVEIGAGGGSIAWVDAMKRINAGPESAGSQPGPACYDLGGERPAITDADVALGRIDPENFAGGKIVLSADRALKALARDVGEPLGLDEQTAAFGVTEVVDENMANAARVHAVENGKDIAAYDMIAFGGAAPLHAARLCDKLGLKRCLVPPGAGVGSAIGFLRAPFAYEAVRSTLVALDDFDAERVNGLLAELGETASRFVEGFAGSEPQRETVAFMRYRGQGWEIPVDLPERSFTAGDVALFRDLFEQSYARHFGRAIEGMDGVEIEVVSWSVKVSVPAAAAAPQQLRDTGKVIAPPSTRDLFDSGSGRTTHAGVFARADLTAGDKVVGPAIIVEDETATLVASGFDAVMQDDGAILLIRKGN